MKKRVMSENDYQLFRAIASMTQDELKSQLYLVLKKKYEKVIVTKDFIYAIGNIPVALLAHMDTVFQLPPMDIYYDTRQNVMWSPDGLGADDRAGVFAILKIIQDKRFRPSIIFTTEEEKGGLGAYELVKTINKPSSDLNFLIQLDRHGIDDCVFYECDNREFVDYIEDFGFKEHFGSFTDISVICPAWGMAGVNLSVGYMDEHSISETLHVDALYDTIDKVKNILSEEKIPFFKYIPLKIQYPWSNSGLQKYKCCSCGKLHFETEILPVLFHDEKKPKLFCADCCLTKVAWCPNCDTAYHADVETSCPICGFQGGIGDV